MKKGRRRVRTVLLLALLALCLVAVASARWLGWQILNAMIQRRFPVVARIRTPELAAWLGDHDRISPWLLDVREPIEYQISHLADAQQIEPGSEPVGLHLPKDYPIVTYCSVGYRSAAYAQKLRQAGFTNVRNLEGSIFRWANNNLPLVGAGNRSTAQVHPFNKIWGLLLRPDHRAPVPPANAES